MQIWAESGKSALPICNYSQILYQFLTFTQNLKRSPFLLFERQPLNRNSRYFKRIVFVLVLVVLPLDTEVVIRKFPSLSL